MENIKPKNQDAFPCDNKSEGYTGMTLRDYFAAKSLNNLLPENATGCYGGYSIGVNDIKSIVEMSYLIADAMLKERENNGSKQ